MDLAFIKLHSSIDEAFSVGDYKNTQITYYTSIQLSPNESYLQMTNISGGIAFISEYTVEIINNCNEVLLDITNNVFINEFLDVNGVGQIAFEIINIGQDFGGRAVLLKFSHNISDVVYYTNPIKITDKEIEKTVRFDYTSQLNIPGYSYENAPFYQSIRVRCEYSKPINKNEVGEYKQISNGNVISTRLLRYKAHEYKCETIDLLTYDAIDQLFANSIIYIDGKRITTNPTITEDSRKGRTNLISASFECYRNDDDVYTFAFQIFEGIELFSVLPFGHYTYATIEKEGKATFFAEPTLATGTVTIYDLSDNSVVSIFDQTGMTIDINSVIIDPFIIEGFANGSYYVHISSGLINIFGIPFDGISDNTTWTFTLSDGMYNGLQYNNSQYLTN